MNSFGLGLVLSFTNNATSGMQSVTNTFTQMNMATNTMVTSSNNALQAIETLSIAGMSLTMIGSQLTSIGESITSVFTGLISTVTQVGTSIAGYKITLSTLFGTAEAGEEAFNWAKTFAESSSFTFESLLPAMTMMKAVGIDVRDTVTTSSGEMQNLLMYASDLALVFPNMRNSYGTGIEAATGALKEYIAEGNARSLLTGAGLDITAILGEEKGETIEDRTRQVADLIEQMGIFGMSASLMGTPTQMLSNLEDKWFNFVTMISDNGVYEMYTELITMISDFIGSISTEEMENFASIIGETLVMLMTPLKTILNYGMQIVNFLRNLATENPALLKTIISMVAFTGVLLVGVGYLTQFSGALIMVIGSIMLINYSASQGITFMNLLNKSFTVLTTKILPLVVIATLLYTAWKYNIFGIRDIVTTAFKQISDIVSLTFDAFTDNTLSFEQWEKANDLGILPFIENVLLLKYNWENFVEGFTTGLDDFFNVLADISVELGVIDTDIYEMTGGLSGFLSLFTAEGSAEEWKGIGEALGVVAGILLILVPIIKIVSVVISAITTFVSWISSAFAAISTGASAIGGVLSSIGTALAGASIATIGWVIAIIAAVIALVAVIIIYRDQIGAFFVNLFNTIINFLQPLIAFVLWAFNTIWTVITSYATMVYTFFSNVFNVISSFISLVVAYVEGVILDLLIFLQPMFDFLSEKFEGVKNITILVFDFIREKVISDFQVMIDYVNIFVDGIVNAFSWLTDIFNTVGDFLSQTLNIQVDEVNAQNEEKRQELQGLDTGGYVKAEGVALLHPDEVVINSRLTKNLDNFLEDYNSPSIGSLPTQGSSSIDQSNNDYSVTFQAGSVVIQLSNASDSELEKAAEKLMSIIERKQQLKRMAVRT